MQQSRELIRLKNFGTSPNLKELNLNFIIRQRSIHPPKQFLNPWKLLNPNSVLKEKEGLPKPKQFKKMGPEKICHFLLNDPDSISKAHLKKIQLSEIPPMYRIYVLASNLFFDKLPKKLREQLQKERAIWELAQTLDTLSRNQFQELEFPILDSLDIEDVAKDAKKKSLVHILNHHHKKMHPEKRDYLVQTLSNWNKLKLSILHEHVKKYYKGNIQKFCKDERAQQVLTPFIENERLFREKKFLKKARHKMLEPLHMLSPLDVLAKIVGIHKRNPGEISITFHGKYVEAAQVIDSHDMNKNTPTPYVHFQEMLSNFNMLQQTFCIKIENQPLENTVQEDLKYIHKSIGKESRCQEGNPSFFKTGMFHPLNISMLIGSLFPQTDNKRRLGEPIADDGCYLSYDGGFIFSGSDGAGWGEKSLNAALAANYAFTHNATLSLNSVSTLHDLIKLIIDSTGIAHESIKLSKGTASHLGIIGLYQPKSEHWQIAVSTVGDLKLFAICDDTCREITQGNTAYVRDHSDPGGNLGLPETSNDLPQYPDMRNFGVYLYQIPANSLLIALSDGAYLNLDPTNLCISPKQAYNELQQNDYEEVENLSSERLSDKFKGWEKCEHAKILRDYYRELKLKLIVKHAIAENKDPSDAIREFVEIVTHAKRTWMEANPDQKEPLLGAECELTKFSDGGKEKEPEKEKDCGIAIPCDPLVATGVMDHYLIGVIHL